MEKQHHYAQQPLSDRNYWEAMEPEGWQLFSWSYRFSASFFSPDGQLVEITRGHLRFFRPDLIEEGE